MKKLSMVALLATAMVATTAPTQRKALKKKPLLLYDKVADKGKE